MSKLLKSRGHKPRKGEVRPCAYCGVEVYRNQSSAKKAVNFFCTAEHNILYMKNNAFSFNCVICDSKVLTQPAQMKYRNRKTCSLKCRAVYRRKEAQLRRTCYTKHQLDRLARYSPEAKEWRKKVFERDDYTCQMCNIRGSYLEADHIKPWAYFPELRYELTNGRTLCRPCHDTTKLSAKKMKELYGKER